MDSKREGFLLTPGFLLTGAAMLGAFSTLSQVFVFREALILLEGNELVLSALLCWWLFGLMMGTWFPTWLPLRRSLVPLCGGALLLAPLLLVYSVTLLRHAIPWLGIPPGAGAPPIYLLILPFLSIFPLGLFYGFTFPVMACARDESLASGPHPESQTTIVSSVFMYEALGSVVGGLSLVLFLLPHYSAYQTVLLMFCASFTWLALGFVGRPTWMGLSGTLLLASILITQSQLPTQVHQRTATARWNHQHPGFTFVTAVETPYQRLELGERDQQYTLFGNGTPLFSFPNEYEVHHWAHIALSQTPDADTILLVGSGGEEMLEAMAEHHPSEIVYVELDPMIQRLSHEYQRDLPEHDQTRIIYYNDDPRAFFSLIPASLTFRVIALNQPDPLNGLTNRVYTREFFSQARAHLAEKGVLVFSITGTPNYEQGDLGFYGATLYWTLRDIFPHVLVLPGTTWWFFASPSPLLTSDPAELTTRYQEAQVQSSLFRPEFYSLYYEPPRIEALHSLLEQNSQAVRNTDTAPVCYFYTFCLWLKQYGYLPGLSLQQLAQGGSLRIFLLGGTMVLMGTLPLIVVRLLSPRSARPQAYPTTILVFNGLTGMSVELCVLLFYQTQTGCLYEHISIFFGVFMAGLALGAQQALSWITNQALPLPRLLWVVDLAFTVLLLVTPLLLYFCRPAFFSVPVIELVLLFWIGVLAYGMGLVFPAASGCIAQHTPQTPAIAGWAGMSDNLGGAVGAFGTGIVLIPLLGLPATIWCLAGFKLLLVGWGWWRIRETS